MIFTRGYFFASQLVLALGNSQDDPGKKITQQSVNFSDILIPISESLT